jgi:hypothetical protein
MKRAGAELIEDNFTADTLLDIALQYDEHVSLITVS